MILLRKFGLLDASWVLLIIVALGSLAFGVVFAVLGTPPFILEYIGILVCYCGLLSLAGQCVCTGSTTPGFCPYRYSSCIAFGSSPTLPGGSALGVGVSFGHYAAGVAAGMVPYSPNNSHCLLGNNCPERFVDSWNYYRNSRPQAALAKLSGFAATRFEDVEDQDEPSQYGPREGYGVHIEQDGLGEVGCPHDRHGDEGNDEIQAD